MEKRMNFPVNKRCIYFQCSFSPKLRNLERICDLTQVAYFLNGHTNIKVIYSECYEVLPSETKDL